MEEDSVEEYLLKHHKINIMQILQDVDVRKHYSININFVELFENDTNLGNNILKNPEEALEELDERILHVQSILFENINDDSTTLQQKPNLHARVYGLPASPELHRTLFPKNEDLELFLQVTGTVVRVTNPKMLEYQRPYVCTKCKHVELIEAIYDQKYIIIPPKKCLNPDKCPGTNFISLSELNVDNCKDYQEIKIQEQASKLGVGSMPCSMWVTLEDDLVDACKPGDDVTICGIVKRRWGPFVPGKFIEVELVLKANHIQINNGQTSPSLITPEVRQQFISFWEKYKACPLEGRDLILKSFSPKLYGMYIVKLAVAVVLAGGSRCTQGNEIGIQIRSEPHILLVGDPGTGKSQLLRYAAKIIPRSVLTTGIGTTSAGLTVAAVMEEGQWQLEGGALVLADGGICCIDEFNSMKAHDRTSIHEAMEQQTISVAKASMVCKLRTRCSILAATNPKGGHLDPSQPLSLNLALPSPLLSRFDIVLMLKDCYDKDWDNLVADYILSTKSLNAVEDESTSSLWNLEMLQQYFSIIRNLNPVLTPQANKILSNYYQAQRRAVTRNKARTTMRLLDSLVRLSQAHARLMFHTEVHVMDALFAVILIESSMHGECAVLSLDIINVQAPFVAYPMEDYAQLVKGILTKLGLQNILKNEFAYLSNGCEPNPEFSFIDDQSLTNQNSETTFGESFITNDAEKSIENNCGENNVELDINIPTTSVGRNFNSSNEIIDNNQSEKLNLPPKETEFNINNTKNEKLKPNLQTSKIGETEITAVDEDFLGDRILRKKKRKNNSSHEHSKQRKTENNASSLNDFQKLNLIPSVNDDFDFSVLDFLDEKPKTSTNQFENEDITQKLKESKIEKNKNCENLLVSTNIVGKKDKPENLIEQVSENIKEKLPTITNFRKKFSFKPRNLNNECDENKNCENVLDLVGIKDKPENVIDKNEMENKIGILPLNSNFVIKSKNLDNEINKNKSCENLNVEKENIITEKIETKNKGTPTEIISTSNQPVNDNILSFREKFAFKPRNVLLDSTKCENVSETHVKTSTDINNCDKVMDKKEIQPKTSQTLFNIQDQDYDSIDFDF